MQNNKPQYEQISDVNLLLLKKKIPIHEATRRIMEIRKRFDDAMEGKLVAEILTPKK